MRMMPKTAHFRRDTPGPLPNPISDEKAAETSPECAQIEASRRLWRLMQEEPGWPKGIIRVNGGYTFISAGLIDDWAHYRTSQFVGVCDSSTSVGDVQFMLSA